MITEPRDIECHELAIEVAELLTRRVWHKGVASLDEILRKVDWLEEELEWHEDELLFVSLECEQLKAELAKAKVAT